MRVTIKEIDTLGSLNEQIAILTKQADAIKAKIKQAGICEAKGKVFTATISRTTRTQIDAAKAKLILGPRLVEAQKEVEVVSIRIKSKLAA